MTALLSPIPLRVWLAGAAAILILAQTGALAWQGREVAAARQRRAAAQAALTECSRTAEGWRRAHGALEARQLLARQAAIGEAASAAGACESRIAGARRSAAAIAALVSRPPAEDGRGCPVREILGGDELDAVLPQP